jgi:hypothetical protein
MKNGQGYEPPVAEHIFSDIPPNTWYERWVEQAYREGLLIPCQVEPELHACAEEAIQRAMAAYMMVQAKGLQTPSDGLYVDNRVASSGDGSIEAPFKTIAEGIAALQPGNTLYIRGNSSGRTYEERLDFSRAGMPSSPMTIKAYPGEVVIITSADKIFTLDQPHWRFENLIFDHQFGSGDAIQIKGGHNAVFKGVEIRNGRRNGIQIFNGDDVRIENSNIHSFSTGTPGNDAHCLITDPTGSSSTTDRLQLINNIIYDCSGDGIQFYADGSTPLSEYATDALIQGNVFYKNAGFYGENAIDAKGAIGVLVLNNEIYGFDTNKAIVVQKGSSNFTFQGNVIHDSHRGIEMRGEAGKSQSGHILSRNTFYNIYGEYVIKFDDVDGGIVQHNTIVNNSAQFLRVEEEGLTNGNIRNNLIFATGKSSISGIFEALVGFNGWFSADPGSLSRASDTMGSDPLFVDLANMNFRLQASSPAIDVGQDVGDPFKGLAPDLGAFEH